MSEGSRVKGGGDGMAEVVSTRSKQTTAPEKVIRLRVVSKHVLNWFSYVASGAEIAEQINYSLNC